MLWTRTLVEIPASRWSTIRTALRVHEVSCLMPSGCKISWPFPPNLVMFAGRTECNNTPLWPMGWRADAANQTLRWTKCRFTESWSRTLLEILPSWKLWSRRPLEIVLSFSRTCDHDWLLTVRQASLFPRPVCYELGTLHHACPELREATLLILDPSVG